MLVVDPELRYVPGMTGNVPGKPRYTKFLEELEYPTLEKWCKDPLQGLLSPLNLGDPEWCAETWQYAEVLGGIYPEQGSASVQCRVIGRWSPSSWFAERENATAVSSRGYGMWIWP
jgi:hypothetical protein